MHIHRRFSAGFCLHLWVIALGGAALSGCGGSAGGDSAAGSAGTVTFIHLNDLHAHLLPHADVVPDAPTGQLSTQTKVVMRGGLARIATLLKQIRAEAEYSVTMNIGDTFHGGVEAMYTLGNAIVAPVNALGVDVGVPGNWDFGYSPAVTSARFGVDVLSVNDPLYPGIDLEILRPDYPNIAANASYDEPNQDLVFLPPTLTKTFGDIQVGFIGLTSDIVAHMYELLAAGFVFVVGEDAYRDLINAQAAALRAQGANIVVVMSELGIHKDYRLAQVIDPGSVDVFFSAHTHEATFTPLASASGALVVEAGNDGYLGRMDISVSDGQVTGHQWTLIPVDATLPEDPEMAQLVAEARAPFLDPEVNLYSNNPFYPQTLTQPIDTVIGHTDVLLDRRRALENVFNALYTDALGARFHTALAMTAGFRFDAVVAAPGATAEDNVPLSGDVTIEDAYRFFPVTYGLATAQVRGQRLKEIMEQALTEVYSTAIFNQAGGWLPGWSGLKAQINLAAPDGQRIPVLYDDAGQEIGDNDQLTITGWVRPIETPGVLSNYEGFTDVTPVYQSPGLQWTTAAFLIDALEKNALAGTAPQDLEDTSDTPVWPEAEFVQPLEGVGP